MVNYTRTLQGSPVKNSNSITLEHDRTPPVLSPSSILLPPRVSALAFEQGQIRRAFQKYFGVFFFFFFFSLLKSETASASECLASQSLFCSDKWSREEFVALQLLSNVEILHRYSRVWNSLSTVRGRILILWMLMYIFVQQQRQQMYPLDGMNKVHFDCTWRIS